MQRAQLRILRPHTRAGAQPRTSGKTGASGHQSRSAAPSCARRTACQERAPAVSSQRRDEAAATRFAPRSDGVACVQHHSAAGRAANLGQVRATWRQWRSRVMLPVAQHGAHRGWSLREQGRRRFRRAAVSQPGPRGEHALDAPLQYGSRGRVALRRSGRVTAPNCAESTPGGYRTG